MAVRWAVDDTAWSLSSTWDAGGVPVAGDTVHLNGHTVSLDITRIPDATPGSTLAALDAYDSTGSTPTAGKLTISLTTLGNVEIDATTLVAGTVSLITPVGNLWTQTLTIKGNITGGSSVSASGVSDISVAYKLTIIGSITGGSAGSAYGIRTSVPLTITGNVQGGSSAAGVYASSTVVVAGNVQGGSGSNAYGIRNDSYTVSVTGNVTGGIASGAYGIIGSGTSNNITVTNGNLVYSSIQTPPISGQFTYNPSDSNYIQIGGQQFPMQLAASKVLHGTVHGSIIGTLAASNIGTATGTTNLTGAILKSGEQVDDVTGNLSTSTSANCGRMGLGL